MILHISSDSTYLIMYPFIKFVNQHFDSKKHFFILCSKNKDIQKFQNAVTKNIFIQEDFFIKKIQESKKIILHGLWSERILRLLFLQPWLLKKCYWVMWGGDFYFPEKQSWIKKQVIKNMGYLVTGNKGDYEYVKKNYRSVGDRINCFMYPSNLYKEYDVKPKAHSTINIQLGNSANPTNNHIEVLEKLTKYKDENIKIYTPLSYGDEEYAKSVISYGKEIFGDKFVPLTELMSFERYLEFLSGIDIAIFAHKRQQAFGNIISLLGMGKKVYISTKSTLWEYFENMSLVVFDSNELENDLLNIKDFEFNENIEKVKCNYSVQVLKYELEKLFKHKGKKWKK